MISIDKSTLIVGIQGSNKEQLTDALAGLTSITSDIQTNIFEHPDYSSSEERFDIRFQLENEETTLDEQGFFERFGENLEVLQGASRLVQNIAAYNKSSESTIYSHSELETGTFAAEALLRADIEHTPLYTDFLNSIDLEHTVEQLAVMDRLLEQYGPEPLGLVLATLWQKGDMLFRDWFDLNALPEPNVAPPLKVIPKVEIEDGEVRYDEDVATIGQVAELYSQAEREQVQKLVIYDSHLQNTQGVEAFPELRELTLNGNRIEKATGLEKLTHLERLSLESNRLESLPGIAGLPLHTLTLSSNPVTTLTNIDAPPTLKRLKLEHGKLNSLQGLSRFSSLEEAGFACNEIETLDASGSLQNLEKLQLQGNRLRSMASIGAYVNLQELQLGDNLQHIEEIELLPQLEKLLLLGPVNEISETSVTALQKLKQGGANISFPITKAVWDQYPQLLQPQTKCEPRNGLIQYRGEGLSLSGIAALYNSAEHSEIHSIYIEHCDLLDTSGIEAFSHMRVLQLENNTITRTVGLEGSPLQELNLNSNKVISLADIEAMPALEKLSMKFNDLKNLSGLARFTSLKTATFAQNPELESLDPGSVMESLEVLDLTGCNVTNIAGIQHFPGLRRLKLSSKISTIEGIEHLTKLEKIELSGEDVLTITEPSLNAIVNLRRAGQEVSFGFLGDPDELLEKYPALAQEPIES